MITLESTTKLNQMASYLRQHGFAEDSIDAVSQANSILRGKAGQARQHVQQSAQEHDQPDAERKAFRHDAFFEEDANALEQLQTRLNTFERSKHLLNSRLDEVSQALQALAKRLERLENNTTTRPSAQPLPPARGWNSEEQATPPAPQQGQGQGGLAEHTPSGTSNAPQAQGAAPRTSARTGNFRSQDVDIMKYFYCGTK
ncbi:hypothetical protein D6783_03875 [Candidatus Woesearchaeota archaeon]|nr:MAG: hypothetical protein D6783_03875 [Candidatus Woesearchaeota archaeon]